IFGDRLVDDTAGGRLRALPLCLAKRVADAGTESLSGEVLGGNGQQLSRVERRVRLSQRIVDGRENLALLLIAVDTARGCGSTLKIERRDELFNLLTRSNLDAEHRRIGESPEQCGGRRLVERLSNPVERDRQLGRSV